MIVLDSTKSLSALATDTTNGLGQISPISCIVTEELNGIYEAEFQVSTNDKYYPLLKQNGLVKIKVGDNSEQIFRIYSISEPINFIVTCKCQHITYDLSKVIITPFTATGAVNVKNQLLSNVLGTYPFTMTTDISNTTSTFNLNIPRSWRECLGGYEGSLLDVFRGEYEYDNLTVKMLARRGADNGVRIAYGKNLTDFQQEQNNENVFDAVYGYAVVDDVCYEASSIYNKTGATVPRVLRVDFSNKYESGDVPTGAELLAYATTYATDNDIEVPSVNIKISFIPLWQTDEYKSILQIERVKLGDTVHVYFEKLGVTASARVIKTVWNSLTEKYDSVELGDARANLNTVINQAVDDGVSVALEDLDVDVGWLDDKIQIMSGLIANGLGLHITQDSLGRIILHNEENIASSQYQYMITSQGFMLSEDYGQTWSSGWDISGNAVLNSLSTITLKALEIYGSYIEGSQILFGDHNNKYILAQVYNDGVNDVGVTFDGSGYVRFQPQEQFLIRNLDSTETYSYNRFVMSKSGSYNQPYVAIYNYDDTQGFETANFIELDAHYYLSGTPSDLYNRTLIRNNSTESGTTYGANMLIMEGHETQNNLYLRNIKVASTYYANALEMYSTSTTERMYLTNFIYNNASNARYANRLSMYSGSAQNELGMSNYDYDGSQANVFNLHCESAYRYTVFYNYDFNTYTQDGSTLRGQANKIYMSSNSTKNGVDITNMIPTADNHYTSNEISMSATSTQSTLSINNHKAVNTGSANVITMVGTPILGGGTNSLTISNYDVDGNNVSDQIMMSKSSNDNTISLTIFRGSTSIGRIIMNRASSGTVTLGMQIFQNSTYGYSAANITIKSDGTCNINNHDLTFGTLSGNNVVKWTST